MKIGKLDLKHKLILAPMAEITYAPFRQIAREHDAGLIFTQMISAEGLIKNNFNTLRYFVFSRAEKPIGIQILGSNPSIIAEAVQELAKYKPDVIDFNCGCSVAKVCKLNMGGKILDNPQQLAEIVKKMALAAGDIPITIKLRLGSSNNSINIIENAKICEANGASAITVHARTRADKYSDEPKWLWLKKVKEAVNIPVIGNGSLFTPEDITKMKEETGVDNVMVGRGALGNPFIFSRYSSIVLHGKDPGEPDLETVKKLALRHIKLSVEDSGEKSGLNQIKKHIIWYFMKFQGLNYLLDNIFNKFSQDDLIMLVEEHANNIINNFYKENNAEDVFQNFKEKVLFWTE